MGPSERIDAPDELLGEVFRRRSRGKRLARHRVHHREHVLHPVIELLDERALVGLRSRHSLLMLLAATEGLFGAELLRPNAEVLLLQAMSQLSLAADFRLLQIEIDE